MLNIREQVMHTAGLDALESVGPPLGGHVLDGKPGVVVCATPLTTSLLLEACDPVFVDTVALACQGILS